MATSGYDKNKDDSTYCPVCLDILKKPRILPCSHSFCHSCLVKCAGNVKTNGTFRCPLCRADTNENTSCISPVERWITRFPVNYAFISHIENEQKKIKVQKMEDLNRSSQEPTPTVHSVEDKAKEINVSAATLCAPCLRDKTQASSTVYCYECSEALCKDCAKHHRKNKFTSDHKLLLTSKDKNETQRLDFVNSLTKCMHHSTEEVKYICRDHDQLCCNECAIVTHRKCDDLVSIEDEIATLDGHINIEENMEKLESHTKKLLVHELKHNSALNESEGCVKDELHCIKLQLEDAYQILEENVKKQYSRKCQRMRHLISVQYHNIERFREDLRLSKEKVISASQFGQDLHLYLLERKMRRDMEQHAQRLTQLHQSSNCERLSLSGTEKATETIIKSLNNSLSIEEKSFKSSLPSLPTFETSRTRSNTSAGPTSTIRHLPCQLVSTRQPRLSQHNSWYSSNSEGSLWEDEVRYKTFTTEQ